MLVVSVLRILALMRPLCLLILLLLGCGHDTKRENPLDPALTPAVELQIALDDTSGTATLTWTPYAGAAAFTEYRVLRNVLAQQVVDTLFVTSDASQTTLIDTSLAPNTAYTYRISVASAGGFVAVSQQQTTPGFEAQPVPLHEVAIDAVQERAVLSWTPYAGGQFEAYRIERRRAGGQDFTSIGRVVAVGDVLHGFGSDVECHLPLSDCRGGCRSGVAG